MLKNSLKNQILIANPALEDENFAQCVILLCDHNEDGAFGIVLNKQLPFSAKQVYEQLELELDDALVQDVPVVAGGPVNTQVGVILHNDVITPWESSLRINEELMLTSSIDIIQAMAKGGGPAKSVLALGYSGWTTGQLEEEIEANSWLTMPAQNDFIFNTQITKQWQNAAKRIGLDYYQYSNQVGHA